MDYAWRRLPAVEAGAVQRHLDDCAACRALLEQERALGARLAAVPDVAPRSDLWLATRARRMALEAPAPARPGLLAPVLSQRQRETRSRWNWTAAISAAAVALGLMMAPEPRSASPAPGGQILAQTLDTARQVTRQSDNPLGEMSDTMLEILSVASAPGAQEEASL